MGPLCPISIYGSPVALLKFQMAPKITLLMSSGSKKKEPRYTCLSEAKASHSLWAKVPASAAHLQSELSDSPYLLTPWCRVLEKLTGLHLVKKFPTFYGTRRFITALTSVRYLSLSWDSPIQSTYPHPTFWRSILMLSTHLRLGLRSGLVPSGFPTKTLYTPLSSPVRTICPAHLILLNFITRIIFGEEYRSFSSSLCNLLYSPVTSSLLGLNMSYSPIR